MSLNDNEFKSFALKMQDSNRRPETSRTDPGTSYEVFRNKTTAVEVVVKDIINKSKKKSNTDISEAKLNSLYSKIEKLQNELDYTKQSYVRTKKGFQAIVSEMRKQIDEANSRETEIQSKNLTLKLENEKLRILLESKTKLVCKLKKELVTLKRVLKFVIKSIYNAPQMPENVSLETEPEYEDFESDVKTTRVKFAGNNFNTTDTFESSISKDSYFDK